MLVSFLYSLCGVRETKLYQEYYIFQSLLIWLEKGLDYLIIIYYFSAENDWALVELILRIVSHFFMWHSF